MNEDNINTPNNAPIIARKLSREEVETYLKMASLRQLGIWHDKNGIIVWLCRQLLEYMDPPDEQ